MSKMVQKIPLAAIDSIEIHLAACRETLEQVAARARNRRRDCKAYILNGGMWNPDGSPCPLLKVGGVMRSKAPWTAYGYGWDSGTDITMSADMGRKNFIATTCLIAPSGAVDKPSYDKAQGGVRGRSAIAMTEDSLVLYCTTDGTSYAKTPERLRDELAEMGCKSAVMLDSGGSSQCDFNGRAMRGSGRKCHNYIIVYQRTGASKPKEEADKQMDGIIQDIMTRSDCYRAGRAIKPKGIMVHSTATPGVMARGLRDQWDKAGANAAVHAFVDDKETIQALPWTHRAWHAGGKANDTHISLEICEPRECRLLPIEWVPLKRGSTGWAVTRLQRELIAWGYDPKGVDGSFGPGCDAALRECQRELGLVADGSCGPATLAALARRTGSYLAYRPEDTADYFSAAWGRAVALCATLCKEYGLDPVDDILCHAEGYKAGIASNHADVMHWFPRHGKDMDDFRQAVKAAMEPVATDRERVAARFGFAPATMDYLAAYKYGAELLKRLAEGK